MTKEEILAMKPGRELNIKVAKEVFGLIFAEDDVFGDIIISAPPDCDCDPCDFSLGYSAFDFLPHFSENESAASLILEKSGIDVNFDDYRGRWEADVHKKGIYYYYPDLNATSQSEAICKAALLAKLDASTGQT